MATLGNHCTDDNVGKRLMQRDNKSGTSLRDSQQKKPYSKPALVKFGSVRNATGGSTFINIDQFCGSSGNGIEDCFR